jgi:GT2 family glycosyltransferase
MPSRFERPDVAIVIVNHEARESLVECLTSLPAATPGLRTEVFVVDNASRDGSAELVSRRFPGIKLIASEENLGFARACNLAIARTQAPFILLLNPDTVCRPAAVTKLLHLLESRPRAAAVGPRLVYPDGTLQASAFRIPTLLVECTDTLGFMRILPQAWLQRASLLQGLLPASGHFDPHDTTRRVDFVIGACLLLRRAALQEVGPIDESFFLYYEEIDLCLRLGQAGWQVFHHPDALVVHAVGRSASQKPALSYLARHHSRLCFYRKHRGRAFNSVLRTTVALATMVRLVASPLSRRGVTSSDCLRVLRWVVAGPPNRLEADR